ncbi:chemotaxis protein CheB [Flavobacterium sp. MK4S-17]|uniref:chemotaxis protein CheB n=1 Tax=Flavobacterium sp. MK4S-17 TaxID=2543737 RepID=UPI0013586D37|nr:chemotaxis protein CheB [Flavobacterium sp. MK4S-17]
MEKGKIVSGCKVVIIGGSAGSLEVLLKIIPKINSASFAIVIIMHRQSTEDTMLEDLFAMKSILPVKEVEDKTILEPGCIYIAPSDYHLLFENNSTLSLDRSEKVNYSRPSIDVSFESAADVYGQHLVGVLLSGANSDGTAGLKAIKNAGGITVVQKPETAEMEFMPHNAIINVPVNYILDVENLFRFICVINS